EPGLVQMFPAESHSLRGFVALLAPSTTLVMIVTWLAIPAAGLAGACVWRNTADDRLRWAALVLALLLASPHLLTYDLLLLAVPLILVLDWLLEREQPQASGAWKLAFGLAYAG